MQPSEVDKLSTYEFRNYMELLNSQVKRDRENEVTLAKVSAGMGVLSDRNR